MTLELLRTKKEISEEDSKLFFKIRFCTALDNPGILNGNKTMIIMTLDVC